MGNNKNNSAFYEQFKFLIKELYRILKPGRSISFHCMNIPAMKERDGYIGLKDFRGDLIRLFLDEGFIFHSEVVIWKDPLVEAVRTKALGLMHKQLCKDSSRVRQGIPDQLITMRKPGDNTELISHPAGLWQEKYAGSQPLPEPEPPRPKNENGETVYGEWSQSDLNTKRSHNIWRRYASPVWMDIRQGQTLNVKLAILMDRRGCGVELKDSYFKVAAKNCYAAADIVEFGG